MPKRKKAEKAFVSFTFFSGILFLIFFPNDKIFLNISLTKPKQSRHGDRTPTAFYGDDPYADYDYPEGVGGLTLSGKERLHRVGVALRAHYKSSIFGKAKSFDDTRKVTLSLTKQK